MRYSEIFWDWNGTVVDDLDASMESTNRMLRARKMRTMTKEDYFNVFGFPVSAYYERLGFDFTKDPFDVLAREFTANYAELSASCSVFPDVRKLLSELKRRGARQYILTSSEQTSLERWMIELDVRSFFEDVIGSDNFNGEGKTGLAARWLKAHPQTNPAESVLIGDTVHDHKVASFNGMNCVLVSRGHGSAAALFRTGVPVFADASSLADYLLAGTD